MRNKSHCAGHVQYGMQLRALPTFARRADAKNVNKSTLFLSVSIHIPGAVDCVAEREEHKKLRSPCLTLGC